MVESQFFLHTSNRVENLAARLVEVASLAPLPTALSQETVMTLNPGIARWLQFEIAKRTGVSFGWDFPLPGKLFARILRGFEPNFDRDGVFPESLACWRVHDLLGKLEAQSRFEQVRAYCNAPGPTRRLAFARRLTRLYDEYLVYRPDVVVDWEDNPEASVFDWQAELWRRLKRSLYPDAKRGRHIARVWRDLQKGQILELGLDQRYWPERLFVFGVSSLAPLYLDFLEAFSRHRAVHVFLLQPSDLYWADLKSKKQIQKIAKKASSKIRSMPVPSSPEDWLFETGNPLLPSLGKQSQMFLDLLIDKNPQQDDASFQPPDPARSQLACLQSDLYAIENRDLARGGDPMPPYDGTLQVHVCSSRRREVETVWDLLVERFEQDSELQANEILVMAPDIQPYRAHIEAVFEAKRGTRLEIPYSVADNAAGSRPGVLSGLLAVYESVSGRASSREVLALLETPLLREAFALSDRDLEQVEFWIRELSITWGWNATHRKQRDCYATDRNTWREFRLRLISGMAFSSAADLPAGFLAYPEVESELCGSAARAVECLEFLFDLHALYSQTHPLDYWQKTLLSQLGRLRVERADWQPDYLRATELIREAVPELPDAQATGAEVYRALRDKLGDTVSGGGYLSGGVTFCSLKPMRAIPANTVALMGMNRLDFPRRSNRLSFDLLAKDARVGDRNTRDEDRQLFLETLLSVRSHLLITYQGLSANDDSRKEPSAVVEELLHYLKNALPPDQFAQLEFLHKRQPFDAEYFSSNRLFTYDPERASLRDRFSGARPPPRINSDDGAGRADQADPVDSLDLVELSRFLSHPAKWFATTVSKIKIAREEDALRESDPLSTAGLERYALRDLIAKTMESGERLDTLSFPRLAQSKLLPLGKLERPVFEWERERAQQVADAFDPAPVRSHFASVEVRSLLLSGEIRLRESDGRQTLIYAGELKANRVLEAWIRHLFASVAVPDFSGQTLAVSLHEKGTPIEFTPVDGAREILSDLLWAFSSGQRRPLPLFSDVSRKCAKDLVGAAEGFEEQAVADALDSARRDIAQSREPSDFRKTFTWDEYHRVCFGDDYAPDDAFLEIARQVFGPCEVHLNSRRSASSGR